MPQGKTSSNNSSKNTKIIVRNLEISVFRKNNFDFISLTDIARFKVASETDDVIKNWMRNRGTIEFLGLWENINNPEFKPVEFDGFKNESGSNSFVLSPQKWINKTNAIGLTSKSGKYGGGTFAHKDIAFEFASWISPEFKLYLIKEFQRLKEEENVRLASGWDAKRTLAKINYKIHTDAIKANLVPERISKQAENFIYADEADVLNVAMFGKTAKDWRMENPRAKKENIRDFATIEQLVVLSNLESINAVLIHQGLSQPQRLQQLNIIAVTQMKSLLGNIQLKKLK